MSHNSSGSISLHHPRAAQITYPAALLRLPQPIVDVPRKCRTSRVQLPATAVAVSLTAASQDVRAPLAATGPVRSRGRHVTWHHSVPTPLRILTTRDCYLYTFTHYVLYVHHGRWQRTTKMQPVCLCLHSTLEEVLLDNNIDIAITAINVTSINEINVWWWGTSFILIKNCLYVLTLKPPIIIKEYPRPKIEICCLASKVMNLLTIASLIITFW